jgi:hypothetical protein
MSLVLAAVLAAAIAFVVLRPEDEPAVVSEATPEATETPAPAGEPTQATPTPTPERAPRPPRLTADRVTELTVRRGETVAFRVRHPSPEEVHVHGYDISRDLPAGETVTVRFPARIEGIFEIELEQSGTQIGSLRVEP